MWTSAVFGVKMSDFSKIMVCPHGRGVLSQCGQGGQFFAILCGRPLQTAPKQCVTALHIFCVIFLYHGNNNRAEKVDFLIKRIFLIWNKSIRSALKAQVGYSEKIIGHLSQLH